MNIFNKKSKEDVINKRFGSDLIKERIKWYSENSDLIISNNLRDKFKNSAIKRIEEDRTYAKDFAKVSLLVDDILSNETIIDYFRENLTDRHKELIVEGIFSAYEYLNKNQPDLYPNFSKFIDTVDKRLNFIKLEGNTLYSKLLNNEFGKYGFKTVSLRETANNLDENFDYLFLNLFEHEFCHCLSTKGGVKGIAYTSFKPFKKYKGIENKRQLVGLNELLTEKMANNILNENFEDIITYHKFSFNLMDGSSSKENKQNISTTLETSKFNYIEGSVFADVLDTLFKNDIEKTYFGDNLSLKTFIKDHKEFKDFINEANKSYQEYIKTGFDYSYSNRTFLLPKLNNFNESLVNLIKKYDEINPLSNEDYFKVTDIFVQNKISDERHKFPFNEIAIKTLDIYKFGKDLKPLDENEVIDILSGRADEIKYKDYYKVLEEANTEREDFIDDAKNKDVIKISHPKNDKELKKFLVKLEKDDVEFSI